MSQPTSLRDRKRAETWNALHRAAAQAALSQGLEQVTVEAVAAAAGVSCRTFFNYFATKEDAVLGLQEPAVDEEVLAAYDVDGDLLEETGRLMLSVMRSIQGGGDDEAGDRGELFAKYPHLLHRRFQYVTKVEQLLTGLVAERLAASARWQAMPQEFDVEETARMIVLVVGTGVRYVMWTTFAHPTRAAQFAALDDGLRLLRGVLKELQ
ncbi:TetR family transcriptional regulator [Arthrobacter mobilis]|uniref:TetR family transcriptional regulator n=1 Tax=Arthrobacter mobilis TaxID=2724944 RepID=A0A7X6H9H9_9MICC|nr:TetR family transcriptional regulator [Arthrobacter mobilis]NKX52939.1 TetR family transcriptional regulator [Arthrobacter mobilis]